MARLDLVFCTQTSWTLSKRYQIRANEKANPCIFLDKELDTGNMRYPAANNREPICGLIKISAMYSANAHISLLPTCSLVQGQYGQQPTHLKSGMLLVWKFTNTIVDRPICVYRRIS